MSGTLASFPDTAPLVRAKGVPETYKPVMLDTYLFPTVAENIGTVLDIAVGHLTGTVVAAKWNKAVFPAASMWAAARMSINLENTAHIAFVFQSLDSALEWGAIGLRRPPAGRQKPVARPDGSVPLTDTLEQDFAAYYEICNVITCGVLARAWRNKLERPVVILLDDVVAVTPKVFPSELNAKNLIAVQGIVGYSERKLPPSREGRPAYERHTALQLIVPAALAVDVLWGVADGTEKTKTDWLVKTGEWRWAGR